MGLYAGILAFVSERGQSFIGTNTKIVADAIEPAAVSFAGIYVMLWGLAHVRGMVQEPIVEFGMRALKIAIIFGVGLQMWQWNTYIVDTFITSPDQLVTLLANGGASNGAAGTVDTFSSLDKILSDSFKIGAQFWESAGILKGNPGAYLAAFAVWTAGIVVTAYAAFLIILSKIFLYILVALGPLVMMGLFFEATSKYFESWIGQLSNYAVLPVLVTMTNVFIIGMFEDTASQAAGLGGTVKLADVFPLIVTALIACLTLAQVPSVAAGMAGGIAISSMGVGRKLLGGAMAPGKWAAQQAGGLAAKKATTMGNAALRKAREFRASRRNRVDRDGNGTAGRQETEERKTRTAATMAYRERAASRGGRGRTTKAA